MSDYCGCVNRNMSRRHFLMETSLGLGTAALATLLNPLRLIAAGPMAGDPGGSVLGGALSAPHFVPRARRVIFLFQSGGPSQLETFDYKPLLQERNGDELPDSVRRGQRVTGMTVGQKNFPLAGPQFEFSRHGQSGAWVSELMPHVARIVDELCIIRSMHTEAINHDPAITFFQTGSEQPGQPCFGSWLSYGLGSLNHNLPTFCVLLSRGSGRKNAQPLYSRLWGSGFLPSVHQGVQFRSARDPVLYLNNPDGIDEGSRRRMLDALGRIHDITYEEEEDPEIRTRVAQYEMAFRMQTSVPEALDISGEPDSIYDLYGPESRIPGTYAANCLLARRLAERDVRFIQLYHVGWDQHGNLPREIRGQCSDVDQPSAALVMDLKQRGLLEDTLVIWGGEFGRTNYCQGRLTNDNYGRDHHPRCFSVWVAGGGIRNGFVYGETDEFGYNIVSNPVHVHDLQATLLYLLGIDHERLTFRIQGRRHRLTDVHGTVVHDIVA